MKKVKTKKFKAKSWKLAAKKLKKTKGGIKIGLIGTNHNTGKKSRRINKRNSGSGMLSKADSNRLKDFL
ncbi:MAG: hypothetical protein ACK5HL_04180 [Bacilli bacterium]